MLKSFTLVNRIIKIHLLGSTINLQIIAEADAESLLQDMGGWMSGNTNPLLQNYCLSIEDIEYWIAQANAHHFKIFAQIP